MISVFDFVFFSLQNRIYTLCQISVFAFLEKEKKIYSHLNLFMAFSKIWRLLLSGAHEPPKELSA